MNETENSTLTELHHSPYEEMYWKVSESMIAVSTFIALFLLYRLIRYAVRCSKKTKQTKLIYLCILSVLMALGRFISDQIVAFLGWQRDDYCIHSVYISIALYTASISPVYVFLWIRQNTFYSDPKMKHLVNKKVIWISRLSLTLLVLGGVTVTVLYQIPSLTGWMYKATPTGCRDSNDLQDFEILPLSANIVTLLGQTSLLGLLLYPLLKTKKRQKRLNTSARRPNQQHGNSAWRRALRRSYRRRQSSGADSTTQDIEMKSDAAEQHVANDAAIKYRTTSVDDSDVFLDRNTSDAGCSDGFASQSDLESENERAKPTTSKRLSRKWNKSLVYFRGADMDASPRSNSGARRTPTQHRRSESTGSAKRMINSKRQSSMKESPLTRVNSDKNRDRKLKRLIMKVFLLALVCVFTDIITTVFQLFLVVPELAYLALYDINLVINITCIVISFKEWKAILVPTWKQSCTTTTKQRSDSVSSQQCSHTLSTRNTTLETPSRSKRNFRGEFSDTASIRSASSARTGSFSLSRPTSPEHSQASPFTKRRDRTLVDY